jgi:hypothetical protein
VLIDVPDESDHDQRPDLFDLDALHIDATDLDEVVVQTQLGELVQYRIKILTELVRGLIGPGLKLYEPAYENFYVKLAGLFVWFETQPIDSRHLLNPNIV